MGRGAPECYVDPQDDKKKINRGDSVCTAYGVEAVIPLEVGLPMTRTTEFDSKENECNLRKD